MNFLDLNTLIKEFVSKKDISFQESINIIENKIINLEARDLKILLAQIGIIPEEINHDSTEEKIFSKLTDLILARTFNELGLKSQIIKQRSNCADVAAKSIFHNYTLVADAKAFRLSRTAKNQKDFKINALFHWKKGNDFAILVSPYYQYPQTNSQIYGQALIYNICLLSWEHLLFFIESGLKENEKINLSNLWNSSEILAKKISIHDKNKNFKDSLNDLICEKYNLKIEELNKILKSSKDIIRYRGENAKEYLNKRIEEIKSYSKEKAVKELIKALKINEKIKAIDNYISSLGD
ncbi:MAG: HindIII family type II restriction endonuclease [Brevinematia bacterium]